MLDGLQPIYHGPVDRVPWGELAYVIDDEKRPGPKSGAFVVRSVRP